MATTGTLPVSNIGGNNQTSPGVGGLSSRPTPIFSSPISGGNLPSSGNPYLTSLNPTPTSPIGMGTAGPSSLVPGTANPGSSITPGGTATYNPATSSGYGGVSNIDKQLTDIYGKGVGGEFGYILQNMSGIDSGIFQQWQQAQGPANAQAQANLNQALGAAGIGANSSVAGLANANLQGQFASQAAGVNADLMRQNLQDTIGILQGTQGAAQQEVAQSGWTDLANVMANITGDVGALFGGSGPSSSSMPWNNSSNSLPAGGTPEMQAQALQSFGAAIPGSGSNTADLASAIGDT